MRTLICFLLSFSIATISCGQMGIAKRALRNLEKGDLDRSIDLTKKALNKDSLLPAALYVRSLLLFDQRNENRNIDSAYHFILEALQVYPLLQERDREKHIRAGTDSAAMVVQKQKIDSAAFQRASEYNSETSFIYFINHFKTARKVTKAITLRNALAFSRARAENTYESYQTFMEKYPQAVQVNEAKRRYEKLYFEKSTKDGKLESYLDFLADHPGTPYRNEIEARIYEVMTADHSVGSYRTFIARYPESKLKSRAVNYLYHVLKEKGSTLQKSLLTDSLLNVMKLEGSVIIPVWEEGKFGFMDAHGEMIITPGYKKINENELCGDIRRDYLLVKNRIIGLDQEVIYHGAYDLVEDLGYGLLKIVNEGKCGVVHKSGVRIMPVNYEDVKLLLGKFLAFRKNGMWGLRTVSGSVIVNTRFSNISEHGIFLLFEKNDLFDLKNEDVLIKAVDRNALKFDMQFDDFEWINDEQLWLSAGDSQTIIDRNLNEIIPKAPQQIRMLQSGFLVQNAESVYLLDQHYRPVTRKTATRAQVSKVWVAMECDEEWLLYDINTLTLRYQNLDSVKLLGSAFAITYTEDSRVIITRDRPILLTENQKLSLIAGMQAEEYLIIHEEGREKQLINKMGQVVFSGSFEQAKPLGYNYVVLSRDGKKGMISGKGEILVQAEYDAIGNYDQGFVSLLKNEKFGIINQHGAVFIPAEYERNLVRYNDRIFIAEQNSKLGLIDAQNNERSSFVYDEIQYWNDSVAFLRQDKHWLLYNFQSGSVIDQGIKSIRIIVRNKDETVAILLKDSGYGLLSTMKGEIISAIYNDIMNVGTQDQPVYFTEKHISEAGFYAIIYYDENGQVIRKQAVDAVDYPLIYCDH